MITSTEIIGLVLGILLNATFLKLVVKRFGAQNDTVKTAFIVAIAYGILNFAVSKLLSIIGISNMWILLVIGVAVSATVFTVLVKQMYSLDTKNALLLALLQIGVMLVIAFVLAIIVGIFALWFFGIIG